MQFKIFFLIKTTINRNKYLFGNHRIKFIDKSVRAHNFHMSQTVALSFNLFSIPFIGRNFSDITDIDLTCFQNRRSFCVI